MRHLLRPFHSDASHACPKTIYITNLMSLPPELRLTIFEFTLQQTRVDVRTYNPNRKNSSTRSLWSLLQINKQLRHEVLPLFYSIPTFHFWHHPKLSVFLDVIGAKAVKNMKRVYFHTRGKCTMFGMDAVWNFTGFHTDEGPSPNMDFCQRDFFLDLTVYRLGLVNEQSKSECLGEDGGDMTKFLCSNDAFGCREQTLDALRELDWNGRREGERLDEDVLTPERILGLWQILTMDNSVSAA